MKKHTQGPWTVEAHNATWISYIIRGGAKGRDLLLAGGGEVNKELGMGLSIICLLILVIGVVGDMYYEDQLKADELYCEMVSAWNADEAAGVSEYDRAGWPDYRNNYEYACAGRE